MVTLLVENPTDDSIEVAVAFLKEAGQKLSEVTSKGTNAIFDMLRNILHEGKLEKRVRNTLLYGKVSKFTANSMMKFSSNLCSV